MGTIKEIGRKIKVIITQLIAFILSFFKNDNEEQLTKKNNQYQEDKKDLDKKKKESIIGTSEPLPDETSTKSDDHLNYKQSVYSVNQEVKDKIKMKVKNKEIYFSEIVIENCIVEVIEERNNFKFTDLEDNKKEKIKTEVNKIKENIIPSLKKEMLENKIKTKEELKTNISNRIYYLHKNNNPITKILQEKEEEKKDIIVENKPLNLNPSPIEEETPIVKERIIEVKSREDTEDEVKENKTSKRKRDFITITRNTPKPEPENRVYFIADILTDRSKNAKFSTDEKTNTKKSLITDTKKETALVLKEKSKKVPFTMVPTKKGGKRNAIDSIKNAVVDTSLILASLPSKKENSEEETAKEEVYDHVPEKTLYKLEEEQSPEEIRIADIAVDREILEEIREDLKKKQLGLNPVEEERLEERQRTIEEIKRKDAIKDLALEIQEDLKENKKELEEEIEKKEKIEKIKDDIEPTIPLEPHPKDDEQKTNLTDEDKTDIIPDEQILEADISLPPKENTQLVEEKEEDLPKNEVIELPKIKEIEEAPKIKQQPILMSVNNKNKELDRIVRKSEEISTEAINETKKEELEDKDYEKYEKLIDSLLYDIEMYIIKNEDTISQKETEKLNKTKEKLKNLKNRMANQKEQDIENEKKELEAELTENEIKGIQEEIKSLHLDHQEEANELVIENLIKLENQNDEKLAEIEQELIKSKLKKAAKAAEIPSILALPFIRHKYFFFFTIGLFINNHFNFLNAIFKRKNIKYEPIDLSEIKSGYDALEKASDMTYKNIVYLDYLESEALKKYPNLEYDFEFKQYIHRLRTKLNNNYEKLQRKQKMINKYIKKVNKKNKVFKKYKLIKDNKAA